MLLIQIWVLDPKSKTSEFIIRADRSLEVWLTTLLGIYDWPTDLLDRPANQPTYQQSNQPTTSNNYENY